VRETVIERLDASGLEAFIILELILRDEVCYFLNRDTVYTILLDSRTYDVIYTCNFISWEPQISKFLEFCKCFCSYRNPILCGRPVRYKYISVSRHKRDVTLKTGIYRKDADRLAYSTASCHSSAANHKAVILLYIYIYNEYASFFLCVCVDRFCGIVVRLPGCRPTGPGFDFRRCQIF
jgi:hypothetical protein